MVSKKFIPMLLAGFLLFASPSFAQNPSVTTNSTSSTASNEDVSYTNETGVVADPVCDPDVFTRMKQKAWMEAQRENYVNQSLILKPDSIFAITCYDKQLSRTMSKLNTKEKDDTGSGKTRFQTAISQNNAVAGQFMKMYNKKPVVAPNKNTAPPSGNGEATPQTVESYSEEPEASDDFSCNEMQNLWAQSMCGNLSSGDLPSLQQMAGDKEARKYPAACSAGKNDIASGNPDYTYKKGIAGTYAGGNKTLKNYNNTSLHRCQTEPLSVLASIKDDNGKELCPAVGEADRCWQGNKTGEKSPENKNVDVISCPNRGCVGKISGSKMVCVPQSKAN